MPNQNEKAGCRLGEDGSHSIGGSVKRHRTCTKRYLAQTTTVGLWASYRSKYGSLTQAYQLAAANGRQETRIVGRYLETIKKRQQSAGLLADMKVWAELEHEFVAVAASFSQRHGIERASWREMGVDAAVLDRSKIAQ